MYYVKLLHLPTLASRGIIDFNLYYGPFARHWWHEISTENFTLFVMTILTELNSRNFLLHIIMIKSQRFTPEDMHKEFIEGSAHNAQFSHDEIPKVETICNWVSRYSAEMKRDVADKMLTNYNK